MQPASITRRASTHRCAQKRIIRWSQVAACLLFSDTPCSGLLPCKYFPDPLRKQLNRLSGMAYITSNRYFLERTFKLIFAIIAGVVVLLVGLYVLATYNRLVKLNVSAQEGASEIDVQLKRRHDLIPNLIETVKGYATHEKSVFEEVTQARSQAVGAEGIASQAQAEGVLNQALGRLFAVAEAYPDLKANQNFLQLQGELTATEDRLSAARRFYNSTIKALNTACQTIPTKWIAPLANVSSGEFFELDDPAEKAVPEVKF